MNQAKAIFSWSGGKDSAYALYRVLKEGIYDVRYLLTTVNKTYGRVSMHGVSEELLHLQAKAVGIPLLKVFVSEGTNEEYERQMEILLLEAKNEGVRYVIFGDIFLADLRTYREENLAKVGMTAVFPLWQMNTLEVLSDFLYLGFKTITCCVNDGYLSKEWVGREIDEQFVAELPSTVDPCGENGEFHTYCFEGPLFKEKISIVTGERVYRSLEVKTETKNKPVVETRGFWFCEILQMR